MISVKKHARAMNINSERDSKTSHQSNGASHPRDILPGNFICAGYRQ